MINRLRTLEDKFTITKAAFIVGFFTLLGKFIAAGRESIFAATFGQNRILDTYNSAFRIPDFITNLFVMSTLAVAFLPIFSEYLTRDPKEANRLANTVFNGMMIVIGFTCIILFIFLTPLTHRLVPGFSEMDTVNTLRLARLFLLSPLIFTASTLFGGILNAQKKFLVASVAPIFYNLGIIAGAVLLYPIFGIMGLGYGVIAGGLLQLFIQVWASFRLGFRWRPDLNFKHVGVKKIIRLYVPRIFAFDLSNVTLLLGTVIGSHLVEGSITSLNQAYNLQSVPVSIFAYSLAVASFPALSEFYALKDERKFIETVTKVVKQLLFFMLPISVLVLLLRAHIVRVILGHGKFDNVDTQMTFVTLGIFSFALFSQSLTTILSRSFFARHNTKTPVLINVACIVANIGLTYLLGNRFGLYGIASAFVAASVCNALLLFIFLRMLLHNSAPEEVSRMDKDLFTNLSKMLGASFAMGLVTYGAVYFLDKVLPTNITLGLLAQAGLAGVFGFGSYVVMGKGLKLKEAEHILEIVQKMLYSVRNGFGLWDNKL